MTWTLRTCVVGFLPTSPASAPPTDVAHQLTVLRLSSYFHSLPIHFLNLQISLGIFLEEIFPDTSTISNPLIPSSPRISPSGPFSQLQFHVFIDKLMLSFLLDYQLQEGRGKCWLCSPFYPQDLAKRSGSQKILTGKFSNEHMNSDYLISCLNLSIHHRPVLNL